MAITRWPEIVFADASFSKCHQRGEEPAGPLPRAVAEAAAGGAGAAQAGEV